MQAGACRQARHPNRRPRASPASEHVLMRTRAYPERGLCVRMPRKPRVHARIAMASPSPLQTRWLDAAGWLGVWLGAAHAHWSDVVVGLQAARQHKATHAPTHT